MRRILGTIVLAMLMSSVVQAASKLPFTVKKPGDYKIGFLYEGVLFQQSGYTIYKQNNAVTSEFANMYWINFEGVQKSADALAKHGEILHFEPNYFAVMKLADQDIPKLSAELHMDGLACGMIFHLKGDTLKDIKRAPEPMVSVEENIPAVRQGLAVIDPDKIKATVKELSDLHTRYYASSTGQGVADMMVDLYSRYAQDRDDVELTTFDHDGRIPQPSLIVRIIGQERPDEIVILGSHIDSINGWGSNSARAPGADDNASGTATNLEIFRTLMEQGIRLKRTLEIHGYSAEEIGLDGSQDIAQVYARAEKNVVSMVQHDMNIYSDEAIDRIWFVTNNTSSSLNGKLSTLTTKYLNVAQSSASLSGGNSDHYSWTRQGYHASFPFENPRSYNHKIHTSEDTIENSGRFTQAAEFARLGYAYVLHFAGSTGK